MITVLLALRVEKVFVFTATWVHLNNSHAFGHCLFFLAIRSPPTPKGPKVPIRLSMAWYEKVLKSFFMVYHGISYLSRILS